MRDRNALTRKEIQMEIKECINCGNKARKTKKTAGYFKCTKCSCSFAFFRSSDKEDKEELSNWSITVKLGKIRLEGNNGVCHYTSVEYYQDELIALPYTDYGPFSTHFGKRTHISEKFLMPKEAIEKEQTLRMFL